MKTAQELLKEMDAHRSAEYQKTREAVAKRVEEFIEGWTLQHGRCQVFTDEGVKSRFGNWGMAEKILREQGFVIELIPGEVTGHLWWKSSTPDQWKIQIPIHRANEK